MRVVSKIPIMHFVAVCSVLFALAMSGCGGGSSSGGTTPPSDTAPTVSVASPSNNVTGVAVNSAITVTFSKAMDPATINSTTFKVTGPGGTVVSGTVSCTGATATFVPSASLAYSAQYTVSITTGAKDTGGNALASAYTFSFTTGQAPAPPTVTTVSPANNATGVAVGTLVTVTFSEAMDATKISNSTFTLKAAGGAVVAGSVSYSGTTATFTPSANLANGTQYTATITTGATNSSGTPLAADYSWSFTTITAVVPVAVSATTPGSGDTGVAVNAPITATFNQAMNATTINGSTFTLTGLGNTAITGTVAYDAGSKAATFAPAGALGYSTVYTAAITTGVQSAAGSALSSDYTWSFTTGAAPANMATLDFNQVNQTIRGFGGSTAWLPVFPQNGVNALFGTGDNEIGVSMIRMRIDPVPANWVTERTNAQAAIAVAPDMVLTAAPWTAPPQFKATSTTQPYSATCDTVAGSCGGYVDPTHYGDLANHLESFVTYMSQYGLNLYAISIQNEPDIAASYESCLWNADQLDAFVKNNRSVITTKLMMPESYSFDVTLSDTALNDASAVGNIDIVAGHLYSSQPFYYANAFNKGKEVWMTEHYVPVAVAGGQPTITDALAAAKEIHDSLTVANYSAYVWWWLTDWDATINYGLVDTSYSPTYFGYAMGQYSRFIRPGYVRVGATDHPSPNVYVSAYKGSGHTVIVVINMGTTAVSQSFTVQNQAVTTLTPYQTTGTAKLAPQSGVTVTDGMFTYSLPAQSITTFVQ
jgi:O-glycosyl hydrolase